MKVENNKNIFVVTNSELGWDCVMSVYEADSEEKVLEELSKEYGAQYAKELNITKVNITKL